MPPPPSAPGPPGATTNWLATISAQLNTISQTFGTTAADAEKIAKFAEERYKASVGGGGFVAQGQMLVEAQMDALLTSFEASFLDKVLSPLKMGQALAVDYASDTADIVNQVQVITGLSSDAVMRSEYGINTTSQKLTQFSLDAIRNLSQVKIELLDGSTAYIRNFETPGKMMENFTNTALRDTRLYRAATEGINEQFILSVTEASKRLGMSAAQTGEVLQRELSATGKVTGEFLERQQKTILAAAQISGASIAQITKDMNAMIGDFAHYGMMKDNEITSLTNTLSKLGLAKTDLDGLLGKFQNFDTAIQSVGQLTAALGATLDTTRLFETANESPEAFINDLREQLDAAGVEFDEMNFIQKKAIAGAIGVDPVILQRLMNDNIEAVGSIADEVAEKAGEMSADEKNKRLLSMGKIEAPDLKTFTKQMAGVQNISLETAQTLEKTNSAIRDTIVKGYDVAVGKVNQLAEKTKAINKELREASERIINAENKGQYKPPDVISANIVRGAPPVSPASAQTPTVIPATPVAVPAPAAPASPPPAAQPQAQNNQQLPPAQPTNAVPPQPIVIHMQANLEIDGQEFATKIVNTTIKNPGGPEVKIVTRTA